jgi:polysaccharide biosynthesis/export protein
VNSSGIFSMQKRHAFLLVPASLFLHAMTLILAPGSVHAQGLPAGPERAPIHEETTQQLNRRLDQSRKAIADTTSVSQNDESRIGPGDLLKITAFEALEMNRIVRVSANGEISLQLLGPVKAAGLASRELESVLQDQLHLTYMKDPHVGVFIRELQSHAVSVVGAVNKPGVFQIPGTRSVIELLSMAGGLADDAGDTALIMRGGDLAE